MTIQPKEVLKLNVKEIKSLPFEITYVNYSEMFKTWKGYTDGVVRNIAGIQCIHIYPAYSFFERKHTYKRCDFIRIPISRITQF